MSDGYHIGLDKILYNMKKLQGLLKKQNIDIKLIQGAENALGNNITINKTKYVLIEFPPMDVPVYAEDTVRELLREHWVIIAHPELNRKIIENSGIIDKFLDLGCYLQLTAGSFLEPRFRNFAEQLVKEGKCHFIATDMHTPEEAADLIKAVEEVKKISDRAMDFVTTNPEKVIAGEKI
jgi:protein-tyrosine phosphatase